MIDRPGEPGPPLLTVPLPRTEPTVLLSGKTSAGEWQLVASVGMFGTKDELCLLLEDVDTGGSAGLCGLPHKDMDDVTVAEVTFPPSAGPISNNLNIIGVVTPETDRVIAMSDRGPMETRTAGSTRFPGVRFFFLPTPVDSDLSKLDLLRSDGSVIATRGKNELGPPEAS